MRDDFIDEQVVKVFVVYRWLDKTVIHNAENVRRNSTVSTTIFVFVIHKFLCKVLRGESMSTDDTTIKICMNLSI